MREEEKHKKSRQPKLKVDDPFLQEIINMSIDSDLSQGEWFSIIRTYVPEAIEDLQQYDKDYWMKFLGINQNENQQDTSSPVYAEREKALPIDSDEDADDTVCNVTKWRMAGTELMIRDLKTQLGILEPELNEEWDKLETEYINQKNILGIDQISDFIHEDFIESQAQFIATHKLQNSKKN